jgi:hypothetical protein
MLSVARSLLVPQGVDVNRGFARNEPVDKGFGETAVLMKGNGLPFLLTTAFLRLAGPPLLAADLASEFSSECLWKSPRKFDNIPLVADGCAFTESTV